MKRNVQPPKSVLNNRTVNPVIARARFSSEDNGTAIPQVQTWRNPVHRPALGRPMFFTRKVITLRQ